MTTTTVSNSSEAVELVYDEQVVKDFQSKYIQPLFTTQTKSRHPCLLLNLAVREKYRPQTTASKADEQKQHRQQGVGKSDFFRRTLISSTHDLVKKIQTWETRRPYTMGSEPIPNCMLAVYLVLNPRDQLSALHQLHHELIASTLNNLKGEDSVDIRDVTQMLYTAVHRDTKEKLFIELDVDTKDLTLIKACLASCPDLLNHVYFIVETHGGFHFVFLKSSFPQDAYKCIQSKQNIFDAKSKDGKTIKKMYIDIRNDPTFPVPGTFQGGFKVRLVPSSYFA